MKAQTALKGVVLGTLKLRGEPVYALLPKLIAFPVFACDPLSPNAYATQENMLIVAGSHRRAHRWSPTGGKTMILNPEYKLVPRPEHE